MPRRLPDLMLDIKALLEHDGELSIRQIAKRINANWETTNKALRYLHALDIVTERRVRTRQGARLFRAR